MTSFKINYKELRQHPEMGKMLEALGRGFSKFDIDFYLVGAVARGAWMQGVHDVKPYRGTKDLDFAILINVEGTYEALKEYLVTVENFHPIRDNTFAIIWNDMLEIDLLPFGEIEREGRVTVQGTGFTSINVDGFKEIYEEGLPEMVLEGEHTFKFCTLPGIVLLKLIAWDDRPEQRRDDIHDISDILKHYFDIYDDTIYALHNDIFEDDFEKIPGASQVLGREIGKVLKRNARLANRILHILNENTIDPANSRIADIMVAFFGNKTEENVKILNKMKKGIEESLRK